jgi:hypothetical protein
MMAETKKEETKQQPKGVVVQAAHEGRVGLYETDSAHEAHGHNGGEIFVKGEPVRVALTAGVAAAIKAGNLVETDEKPAERKAEK